MRDPTGLRQLPRTPAFTFVAILTLALGIGANTAFHTIAAFRPLRSASFDDVVSARVKYRRPGGRLAELPRRGQLPGPFFDVLEAQLAAFGSSVRLGERRPVTG